MLATILARRYGVSGTLFAVGPAIPLVPGSYAYKAVMGIVMVAESPQLERSAELLLAAFDSGIKAVLTILFLSFGIALRAAAAGSQDPVTGPIPAVRTACPLRARRTRRSVAPRAMPIPGPPP